MPAIPLILLTSNASGTILLTTGSKQSLANITYWLPRQDLYIPKG